MTNIIVTSHTQAHTGIGARYSFMLNRLDIYIYIYIATELFIKDYTII